MSAVIENGPGSRVRNGHFAGVDGDPEDLIENEMWHSEKLEQSE